MVQQTMYPAQPDSPDFTLASDITSTGQTTIVFTDLTGLLAAPNTLTIRQDEYDTTPETVYYATYVSGNSLTVTRGYGGTAAKTFTAGALACRAHTALDHNTIRANILDLDSEAFHKNTDGEINGLSVKAVPDNADVLLIEDSDGSVYDKKKITIASLPIPVVPSFEDDPTKIKINGVQALGSSGKLPNSDHVHPTDTSRQAALTNPVTGPGSGCTIGHLAVMNNVAGTEIKDGGDVPVVPAFETAPTNIKMNGVQALGASGNVPDAAHVHPTDTSRAATTQALDTFGSPTNNTDLDATTSAHGLVVKATAPASGVRNVVAIDNGELVYKNAALVDSTNPANLGSVSPGTQLVAARRDHVHAMPSAADVGAATTSNKIDDFAVCDTTDTTKDANTTNHGLLLKAVAPVSGFMRFVGIAYGETIYALKELFAATLPSMNGSASAGTAVTAARIDHIHPTDTSRAAIPAVLGSPTYTSLQNWIDSIQSGGRIYGGVITDAGSGLINISAMIGMIKIADYTEGVDPPSATKFFDLGAQTNWGGSGTGTTLTTNSVNYIYVDYNSGTPKVLCTTNRALIRYTDQFTLGKVFKESATTLEVLTSGVNLENRTRRVHERWVDTFGILSYANGLITSTSAGSGGTTPYLGPRPAISSGVLYEGSTKITVAGVDCNAGGTFNKFYYNPTTLEWVEVASLTQLDVLNYNKTDTGTGLAALTASRYGVHWLFICPDNGMYVLMGQGDYTLAQAQAATLPTLIPNYLSQWAKLAAKIIVQKSSTTAYQIVSAWTTAFPVTQPTDHNSLAGLQGGTTDQYYHLTAAQIGTWATFSPTPVWGTADPTITTTVSRYARTGNVVTFNISFVISNGNAASSLVIALPVAAPQIATFQLPLIAFKKITSGGTSLMSDPFAYIDYTEATPTIKFNQFGTLPSGYSAILNISGTYGVT